MANSDSAKQGLFDWFDERYGISEWLEFFKKKTVPVSGEFLWYYFGGVSLFLFIIQVLSGILLLMYYNADPDRAFESIRYLMSEVEFGWLIRSIHSWSANLMVLAVFIHMFSVFFTRAYRPPRELTWVTGVLLFFLSLGFGFSGYLLPWNELAFFATKVGTDIAGSVPIVGEAMLNLLRGGEDVTGATLSRFFGLHVAIMPLIFFIILTIHLFFVQVQGMSIPLEWEKGSKEGQPQEMKRMPFFPNFALRDLLLWLIVLNLLAILAVFFPWELGVKADPFSSAPAGIRPEWYFMFMFETLKLIPAHILFIEGEIFGVLMFGLAFMMWIMVPFIDTRVQRGRKNRNLIRGVKFWVYYILYMTVIGYFDILARWFSSGLKIFGLSEEGASSLFDFLMGLGGLLRWVSILVASVAGIILLMWFFSVIIKFIKKNILKKKIAPPAAIGLIFLTGFLSVNDNAIAQMNNEDQCVICHLELEDEYYAPAEYFNSDVHSKAGLSCSDCHGGINSTDDPDEAMWDADNWFGVPEREEVPEFCGKCHSDAEYMKKYNPSLPIDQVRKYNSSVHGKMLKGGDENVAVCADCHLTHTIRKSSDAKSSTFPKNIPTTCDKCHGDTVLMSNYGLPTSQFSDYKAGVHGISLYEKGDMSAPACNDCHGSHGAAPPGVTDVALVCSLCHLNNYELFEKSPMGLAFHDIGEKGCITCHGNHAIAKPSEEMLGMDENSVCAECHEDDDEGGVIALKMKEMILELKEGMHRAEELVREAEQKGVEVSEAFFILKDAKQSLHKSRTLIHSFDLDLLGEQVTIGNVAVEKAETIGLSAIDEFEFRKKGLGIATLIITILGVSLWLKIKELEKK